MIEAITNDNFKSFGHIIECPAQDDDNGKDNRFRVVCSESAAVGWRIACLHVREKSIDRLEQHRGSLESFEPIRGKCLLYVADRQEHARIRCFYLSRPVILQKGIWHGVVSITEDAEIKITENAEVDGRHWVLGMRLGTSGEARAYDRPPALREL